MADLSQGQSASIVLGAGETVRVTAAGTTTVKPIYGAPAGDVVLTANYRDFGPYGVPAKLDVKADSGTCSYVLVQGQAVTLTPAEVASGLKGLVGTERENAALRAVVFGAPSLPGQCDPANPSAGPDCYAALAAAASLNRPILLPAGHWYTSQPVDVLGGMCGAGRGVSFLHYPINVKGIYCVGSPTSFRERLVLRDFTIVGALNGNWLSTRPSSTEDCITGAYYKEVEVSSMGVQWSRNIGVKMMWCGKVTVRDYMPEFTARDGIYLGGCYDVSIDGVHARHIDDDVISAHSTPNNTGWAPPAPWVTPSLPVSLRSVSIRNVHATDTKGIRVLGAVYQSIENVLMIRPKEQGGMIGGFSVSEGLNDSVYWAVKNYRIFDVIDGPSITAAGGNNASTDYGGYYIESTLMSTGGGTTAVAPGLFDTAADVWIKPEAWWTKTNTLSSVPRGGSRGIDIDLYIAQTLPNTALYSDWGVGMVFTGAGWVDPVMTSHLKSVDGITCATASAAFSDMNVKLTARNLNYGINLSQARHFSNVRFNVDALRLASHAIYLGDFVDIDTVNGGVNAYIDGRFEVTGCFDLDPYHEHANRTSTGGWTAATGPFILSHNFGDRMSGLHLHDFVLRNACGPHNNVSDLESGKMGIVERATYVCQPDTSGSEYSSGNLGVRYLVGAANASFVIEGSDPTAANYHQRIWNSGTMIKTAIPSAGWYFPGHFVRNQTPAIAGSAASRYVVTGWTRITAMNSGATNHTAGTDWAEARALTGT